VINNYIESIIDNHQKEFGLYFSGTAREVIHESINKGIYAFQLIYHNYSQVPPFHKMNRQVEEIKKLDHKLCVHEDQLNTWSQNKMWSYDGGQRYQWSEMETLIFDPSLIRNIKIESIL
jgi:hypothetical protein